MCILHNFEVFSEIFIGRSNLHHAKFMNYWQKVKSILFGDYSTIKVSLLYGCFKIGTRNYYHHISNHLELLVFLSSFKKFIYFNTTEVIILPVLLHVAIRGALCE